MNDRQTQSVSVEASPLTSPQKKKLTKAENDIVEGIAGSSSSGKRQTPTKILNTSSAITDDEGLKPCI